MVTVPLAALVMVTVFGIVKLFWLKVRVAGLTVAMFGSLLVTATLKLPVRLRAEFRVRATVYVAVWPIVDMVSEVLLSVRAGVLLFTMVKSAMLLLYPVVRLTLPSVYLVLPCICMAAPLANSYELELIVSLKYCLNATCGSGVNLLALASFKVNGMLVQLGSPFKRYLKRNPLILGCSCWNHVMVMTLFEGTTLRSVRTGTGAVVGSGVGV